MKWLLVAVFIVGLSQKPAQLPERQGATQANGSHVANQAGSRKDDQQPAARPTPSPAAQNHVEATPNNDHANDSSKKTEKENLDTQRKLTLFTGALALVAALQLVAMVWQGYVQWSTLGAIRVQASQMIRAGAQTERIIGSMTDTAVRELRAYVCLSGALIKFKQERAPEVQIHMKNCGKTPAYEMRWWIHQWIAVHPLNQILPEPPENFPMSTTTLPPGEKPHMMLTKVPTPIPEQLMPLFGTPQMTLYIYGRVTYKDAFGNSRYTNYRLMYGGKESAAPLHEENGILTGLLRPDTEGNEAD